MTIAVDLGRKASKQTNKQNMVYFDQILHTNECQPYLTTGMCISLYDGRGFAEHHFSW